MKDESEASHGLTVQCRTNGILNGEWRYATPAEVAEAHEVWANVEGTKGMYQVSTHGRVRSWCKSYEGECSNSPKILAASPCPNGYPTVHIKGRTVRVHRLVAEAFIGGYRHNTVNHIDGDKTNNRVENLEWSSYSHNNAHAYRIGRKQPKLAVLKSQWPSIVERMNGGESIADIAASINVGEWNIRRYIRLYCPDYKPNYAWRKGRKGHHSELNKENDDEATHG